MVVGEKAVGISEQDIEPCLDIAVLIGIVKHNDLRGRGQLQ